MGDVRSRFTPFMLILVAMLPLSPALAALPHPCDVPAPTSGSQCREAWVRRDTGTAGGDEVGRALAVSPDGALVYVAGGVAQGSGNGATRVTALDAATGTPVWAHVRDTDAYEEGADALVLTPDGRTLFAGTTHLRRDNVAASVTALDARDGRALWTTRVGEGLDLVALGVDPAATRIFVTTREMTPHADVVAFALDVTTGAEAWRVRLDGPAQGYDATYAPTVPVSPDGTRVFVAGTEDAGVTGSDGALAALDAATGRVVWRVRHDHGLGDDDTFEAVGLSPDGARVVAAGVTWRDGADRRDVIAVGFDAATGEEVWRSRHGGPGWDEREVVGLRFAPDGHRVHVAATAEARGWRAAEDAYAFVTLTLAPHDGMTLWTARWQAPAGNLAQAWDLAASPDGARVYVTGEAPPATAALRHAAVVVPQDYVTLAYDAVTGRGLGEVRFDGVGGGYGWDFARAVAVSPSSARVFVTGGSVGASETPLRPSLDAVTVAYDGEVFG